MPPRKVDERKTRKALAKLRRTVDAADAGGDKAKLSDWEKEFAQSVEKRLETYGSAFTDPSKGALDEPLSARQAAKLAEIGRKARGKGQGLKRSAGLKAKPKPKSKTAGAKRGGLKQAPRAKPRSGRLGAKARSTFTPRVRDIAEDMPPEEEHPDADASQQRPSPPSPKLRIIKGGLED